MCFVEICGCGCVVCLIDCCIDYCIDCDADCGCEQRKEKKRNKEKILIIDVSVENPIGIVSFVEYGNDLRLNKEIVDRGLNNGAICDHMNSQPC